MQKILALLALSLLLTTAATAQLYDVRPGDVSYDKHPRQALKVQVEGRASAVRDYFQDWMKTNYNVRLKTGGILGMGKGTVLSARQTPASTVSGKLVDLYASFIAPTDSITEVAIFGGFDDNTFFTAENTANEYNALRGIAQNFAGAARLKASRDMIAEAEQKVKDGEKERARLEKDLNYTRNNTTANLAKIEALKTQNLLNKKTVAQDSVLLLQNAVSREQDRVRLQRRRDRLTALDRK